MDFILILSFLGAAFIMIVSIWQLRVKAKDLEQRTIRLLVLRKLDEIMMTSSTNLKDVAQKVTDAIAYTLGFEIGVLALVDEKRGVLKRVAMSNTTTGVRAKNVLPIPYNELEIPLRFNQNISVQAVKTGKIQMTHNLYDLFLPVLDRDLSRRIQETVNVKTSFVYPVKARGKTIGVMIVSISRAENQLTLFDRQTVEDLIDVVGIALDNAMLYQDLLITGKKLEDANIRLKELDLLKDEFVSVASHELRTPMTAIRSYAWMALHKSDIPLSQKLKRYLYRTLISTERLINLVSDMLNLSRIESGKIEINPISLNIVELVKEVTEDIKVKAEEKKLKVLIMEQKIPQVFADPEKVEQILLNLVGNALKFTFPGGLITINFFTDGKIVEISIKDDGQGISVEDMGKLFKKFGRLDSSYESLSTSGGTGLGRRNRSWSLYFEKPM
ncbi:MAG: Uncharacterized protein G01um101493_404 [Microgenomates group bacterium Gr01-1014_93]|nr:MAG: Uncharacterized protein G01um101493_404 [Microgenomates group bacterium Gr01-1014_93]